MAATLKKQKKNTKDEFEERAKAIIVEFAQQVGEFLSEEPIRIFVSFVIYLVKSPFSLIQICSPMSWVFLLFRFGILCLLLLFLLR